jgi:hypothetical protein
MEPWRRMRRTALRFWRGEESLEWRVWMGECMERWSNFVALSLPFMEGSIWLPLLVAPKIANATIFGSRFDTSF